MFILAPIRKGHLRCTVLNNPTTTPLLVKFKITLLLVLSFIGMAAFFPSVVCRFECSGPATLTNLIHLGAYIWNFDKSVSDYCLKWHNEMSCGVSSIKMTFIRSNCSNFILRLGISNTYQSLIPLAPIPAPSKYSEYKRRSYP